MKRIRNIVIGGIQNKIFNLILLTVILLSAASSAVYIYHSRMLTQLSAESGEQQKQAIEDITSSVMDEVVLRTLQRSGSDEARIADEMFTKVADRVAFLADYPTTLLANPENFPPRPFAGPRLEDEGRWTAKVIYADGTDAEDSALAEKIGRLANVTDMMVSLCPSTGADDAYIGLPEGVHMSVSEDSDGWFVGGNLRSYDPRRRGWYRQAAEA